MKWGADPPPPDRGPVTLHVRAAYFPDRSAYGAIAALDAPGRRMLHLSASLGWCESVDDAGVEGVVAAVLAVLGQWGKRVTTIAVVTDSDHVARHLRAHLPPKARGATVRRTRGRVGKWSEGDRLVDRERLEWCDTLARAAVDFADGRTDTSETAEMPARARGLARAPQRYKETYRVRR